MKEEERIMEKDKETVTVVFRDEAMSKVKSKMTVRMWPAFVGQEVQPNVLESGTGDAASW